MNIFSTLTNATPFYIYSGKDVSQVPLTVSDYAELSTMSAEFLRSRLVMNSFDNTYRVYDDTGTSFAVGAFVGQSQLESYVAKEFESAFEGEPVEQMEINFRDFSLAASKGYGKNQQLYGFVINSNHFNEFFEPPAEYGKMFFVQDTQGQSKGYWMVHESLFGHAIDGKTQRVAIDFPQFTAALGDATNNARTIANDNDAIFNCQGRIIHNSEDPNAIPPENGYYTSAGRGQTTNPDAALDSIRDFYNVECDTSFVRGRVLVKNETENEVIADSTSEYFCVHITGTAAMPSSGKYAFAFLLLYYDDLFFVDVDKNELEIRDEDRAQDGYGWLTSITSTTLKVNEKIELNTIYGSLWFVQKTGNSGLGAFLIHEDMLDEFIDETTQTIPFFTPNFEASLGKLGSYATIINSNAIWNCQGVCVGKGDGNNLTPSVFYKENGETTSDRNQAALGTLSTSLYRLASSQGLVRASVIPRANGYDILPDASSDYFVVELVTDVAQPVPKLFQFFPQSYDFSSATSFAVALGKKIDNNTARIEQLENNNLLNQLIIDNTNRLINAVACANRSAGLSAYVF